MRIDRWQCDKCGKEFAPGKGANLSLDLGKEHDMIEGTSQVWRDLDLCSGCVLSLLQSALAMLSVGQRKGLSDQYTGPVVR